jgi:hypothetical protein
MLERRVHELNGVWSSYICTCSVCTVLYTIQSRSEPSSVSAVLSLPSSPAGGLAQRTFVIFQLCSITRGLSSNDWQYNIIRRGSVCHKALRITLSIAQRRAPESGDKGACTLWVHAWNALLAHDRDPCFSHAKSPSPLHAQSTDLA